MRIQPAGYHPDLQSVLTYLLSSGGKRVRPTVTLLAGGMLDADKDSLLSLAAAVELLHTATLVHDDLIDGASLRRGIPTLNTRWSSAATVLAGDSTEAYNDVTDPFRVIPQQTELNFIQGTATLPPHSLTIVNFDDYE